MKTLFRILPLLFLLYATPASAQQEKKNGKVIVKHANGEKKESGNVKNYQKEGEWKYWNDKGQLRRVEHYKDGRLHGLCTEYHNNGQKSEEINYVDGKRDGTGYGWHTGGQLSAEVHYVNGKKEGVHKWWYPDGKPHRQESYINNELQYRWVWWRDGRLADVQYYKNGLKEGTWREYPEKSNDTLPQRIKTYSADKLHGVKIEYRKGKMTEELHYREGKKNGLCRKWDNDGNLRWEENYLAGRKHGISKTYEKGKLRHEANYVNGERQGPKKDYDPYGRLRSAEWYTAGRQDSVLVYYPNGRLFRREIYSTAPGEYAGKNAQCTEWDSLGRLAAKGSCRHTSDWITYYPDGKTESITPWRNGSITGTFWKWYPNGKPMLEIVYEANYRHSEPKAWDEKGRALKAGTPAYETVLSEHKPIADLAGPEGEIVEMEMHYVEEPAMAREMDPNEVFTFAEEMPQFPGGDTAMRSFVNRTVKYPELEKEMGKQGTVYIQFIVEVDGTISGVKAMKEVPGAPGLTKEAIRVVSAMPKWVPGKMNGRAVRAQMTVPIKFVLQ